MSGENIVAAIPPADIAKLLLANEQENGIFIRHYEDVRFKITQVTVTLAGLLVGASRFVPQPSGPPIKLPVSLFIITLGLIGILISAKYSERADRHATIARAYRRAASAVIGTFQNHDMEQIHQQAVAQHTASAGIISAIRARHFWFAVHACVVLLGILVEFV